MNCIAGRYAGQITIAGIVKPFQGVGKIYAMNIGGFKMGKQRKTHMIGNAHIDPVWLWKWQEGYGEIKATFQSALERSFRTSYLPVHVQLIKGIYWN